MKPQWNCRVVLAAGLLLPVLAWAQASSPSPGNANALPTPSLPSAPGVDQNRAPTAPGVNNQLGARRGLEGAAESPAAAESMLEERTSDCAQARFPSDPSPPCTVVAPPVSPDQRP